STSPTPLATPLEREHQPALPRVPPKRHRDPRSPTLSHHDRRGDQQPAPAQTRLPDTDRILHATTGRRTPCYFDALTPPWGPRVNTAAHPAPGTERSSSRVRARGRTSG